MTQIKKAKIFLLIALGSLFSLIFLYTISYYFLANIDFTVTRSYKQFLLQHTEGERFIIDSGSNSIHGINASMLEKELGVLTINLADHAGYPLHNKLLRIEQYSHPGDILILPLEWPYYTYSKVPGVFSENILGKINHYYFYDSKIEEIKQIWKSPFSSFSKGIKNLTKLIKYNYLKKHIEKFNNGERGTSIKTERDRDALNIVTKNITCDRYVFGMELNQEFVLSKTFKNNIKTINRLQKKGIKVFFTWPVVAGDNCYSKKDRKKIDSIISTVKNYIQENGLTIIGDPYANVFSRKYLLDTYYHVIPEARDVRTKKLITDIRQSTVYQWFKQNPAVPYSLDISL